MSSCLDHLPSTSLSFTSSYCGPSDGSLPFFTDISLTRHDMIRIAPSCPRMEPIESSLETLSNIRGCHSRGIHTQPNCQSHTSRYVALASSIIYRDFPPIPSRLLHCNDDISHPKHRRRPHTHSRPSQCHLGYCRRLSSQYVAESVTTVLSALLTSHSVTTAADSNLLHEMRRMTDPTSFLSTARPVPQSPQAPLRYENSSVYSDDGGFRNHVFVSLLFLCQNTVEIIPSPSRKFLSHQKVTIAPHTRHIKLKKTSQICIPKENPTSTLVKTVAHLNSPQTLQLQILLGLRHSAPRRMSRDGMQSPSRFPLRLLQWRHILLPPSTKYISLLAGCKTP